MQLSTQDIDAVCNLVSELCGVYLDGTKSYLIESRLAELVKRSGCASYRELAHRVRCGADQTLRKALIDAITTNETMFFRDSWPFEALGNKIIPELINRKLRTTYPKRIRVWSAACSTGQEAYSLAMLLAERISDIHQWDLSILANDVSEVAIERASRGWYTAHEVARGLSAERRDRFFRAEGNGWQVEDRLRKLITFERSNLLDPLATKGKFDIIFCRNVAIYFAAQVRDELFQRLANMLQPGGSMFVGSQESLADLGPRFVSCHHNRAVFYQPNHCVPSPTVL